jgi:hypothetical protein
MRQKLFAIKRDARGSLIHVRGRDDGACGGCIEAGCGTSIVLPTVREEEERRWRVSR